MRDEMRDDARFAAPECEEVELRDALPAFEHGRLPDGERRRVERHVEVCPACGAELALLRDVRGLAAGGMPTLDFDRIALAVTAATVRPQPAVVSLAAHRGRKAARPAWAARLASAGGLRAAAAVLIVAVGGALVATRGGDVGATADVGRAPAIATMADTAPALLAVRPESTPAVRPTRASGAPAGAHALGERFDDLSDDELNAVLVALETDDASLPALEPAVLAPEYRGGGQ